MTNLIPETLFNLDTETITKFIAILNTKLNANIIIDQDNNINITRLCKYFNDNNAYNILLGDIKPDELAPTDVIDEITINNYIDEVIKQNQQRITTIINTPEVNEPENEELYEYLKKKGHDSSSSCNNAIILQIQLALELVDKYIASFGERTQRR